jgi:poly-gamma-glutamate synthesis protein (capsule biosynthesis protein)
LPAFTATVRRIGPDLRDRMRFSYRPGCPVSPRDLRYVRMSFVRFDRSADTGEMVVHKTYAKSVVKVFQRLYESRWPIRRMRLVDDYRGDDDASLAANNTSGFNCRSVSGGEGWSEHAYGRAIDINPVQNPYVYDSVVSPPSGRRFTDIDRSGAGQVPRGVIRSGDVVVSAFRRIGWEWGGDWTSAKDYQHFSATGH